MLVYFFIIYIYFNEVNYKLNLLWPILIITSFIFALCSGNIDKLNNSIFTSISDVVKLSLTLVGNMCLWCGIMKIIQNTKIMPRLTKTLKPLLNWLFPDAINNVNAMEDISINTISNIIGIGNASTPAGIKAMEELQKENAKKNTLTDSMIMLIVLNTTSIQILPTTVIAIRSALGSINPSKIIIPIWISTIIGTIFGVLFTKILLWRKKK